MTDISSQTLHLVAKELTATLNEARASLEAYAERPDQHAFLEKCAEQLHLAHGVLRLVEVYGAALLAEEMEHVSRYLLSVGSDQKRQGEQTERRHHHEHNGLQTQPPPWARVDCVIGAVQPCPKRLDRARREIKREHGADRQQAAPRRR